MSKNSSEGLIQFLRTSFPSISPDITASDLPQVSSQIYPDIAYTDNEKIEISRWLISAPHLVEPGADEAKQIERLGSLNIHLSTRTTLLGSKPSVADLGLFFQLAPTIKEWTAEERTGEKGYHHIVRHIDFVQNSPVIGLLLQPDEYVNIDPDDVKFIHKPLDAKEEKERRKKEKAAVAAKMSNADATGGKSTLAIGRGKDQVKQQGQKGAAEDVVADGKAPTSKREKKEKPPKQQKAAIGPAPLSPRLIDLRVGHILKATPHPDADSLYVSTIACGDAEGTENTSEYEGHVVRTVCSGLKGLVPLGEMQGRKIVAVCNLKPVTMRGVKSAAMVLAASPRLKEGEVDDHKGPVELVDPPEEALAGERVVFEGWEGEPEGQLNPKKKVFESLQPGLTTTEDGAVGFDPAGIEALEEQGKPLGILKTKGGGICKVKSLKNALVR